MLSASQICHHWLGTKFCSCSEVAALPADMLSTRPAFTASATRSACWTMDCGTVARSLQNGERSELQSVYNVLW